MDSFVLTVSEDCQVTPDWFEEGVLIDFIGLDRDAFKTSITRLYRCTTDDIQDDERIRRCL